MASPEKPFNHDHADWLGGQEEPLQGFTTNKLEVGVSMWSDIFLHDAPNGDKFAIVIAESKTVSDPKWTYADNSMFFFLNAMVSSVQIFNLKASLEEKHLDYFKFVAKFGKLGLESKGLDEPFGKLIFLTRDSVDPHYGFEAGKSKEENLWKVKEKDSDEHKSWIESANNAFTGFSNYQMIAPGPKIHEKDFDGRRSQLDHAFVDQIKDFAEHVLSADKLNVKKIHKEFLDVSKYYAYLKKYEQIMKTDDLKSVAAIYNAKI